jgi:molybdenum cofactor cytidylyltransferase
MIFREFALDEAEGIRLAHTLKLSGVAVRKGRVLDAGDIAALRAAGLDRVTGARLAADDLDEDAAAAAVAGLLGGAGLVPRAPYTGRCNLHAGETGVVVVDRETIDRLNRIDEAITVGTLTPFAPVRRGQAVATVKIIPFAVNQRLIEAWRASVAAAPPLRLAPLKRHRAALILSETAGISASTVTDAAVATRRRLTSLGSELSLEVHCAHDRVAVRDALAQALAADCDLILVSGATVTKDRGDVIPAAIGAIGGTVEHFGMPVEPGNMLLLAQVDAIPVIVLPGCARSPRTNGLDWVLHRLLARLPLSGRDVMGMGVGGLIRSPGESAEAPEGASAAERPADKPLYVPHIAALVLAAGKSRRMGDANKLLRAVDGVPLVRRAADAASASRCSQVMVVTGFDAERIEAALDGSPVSITHNPNYAAGMSASLRSGLKAVPRDVDGVIVLLGDMPRITSAHVDRLIDAFDPEHPSIIVPECGGRRGNPVLWPKCLFEEIRGVSGDVGARGLLQRHAADVVTVEFDSDAIFADIDTPVGMAESGAG